MHIFDFFYRVYVDYKKRGEEQVISPTIEIGTFIALLFVPIWWGVYSLFIIENDTPNLYVKVALFLFYFLLYIRYKKKKDIILKKMRNQNITRRFRFFAFILC